MTHIFMSQTTETMAKEKNATPVHRMMPRWSLVIPITAIMAAATQIPIRRRSGEWPPAIIQKAIQGEKAKSNLMAPIP
jgi:cyanate permease